MGRRIEQQLVLVLAVQIDEPGPEIPERAAGHQSAVDGRPAAALRGDLAPDDRFAAVGRFEDGLDRGRLLSRSYQVRRSAAADQQADGTDEDGLAGAGFAGEDAEARLEFELERVDDGEVADGKESQHGNNVIGVAGSERARPRTECVGAPSTILSDV